MIPVKKLLEFTEEEQILYQRYIKASEKKKRIQFIKVPVFWVIEDFRATVGTSYKIIYSNGNRICSDIFDVLDNKFDIVDYKDEGLSYAIILKKKTNGIIFEREENTLFRLSFNPHCKWNSFQ
ncbi:hypothetical protein [Clostridium guangxiense]|uniref:hypothetical protein n=1 Tax=Clostridium guangxiense TaxID=1662055 RepID=UPI001E64E697|nr:hypothetical protein [Clostridium guangxiense]MCD2345091.1 hypothetical protein [Clostridium guangxiense]